MEKVGALGSCAIIVLLLSIIGLTHNAFAASLTTNSTDTFGIVDKISKLISVIAKGVNIPGNTNDSRAPSTVMDDGIPIGVVVPPNFNGVVIYTQNETAISSKYVLVSQVINIIPINGTTGDAPGGYECEGQCDVIFVIHESNVIKAGLPVEELCNLVILHDKNDDGDFDDADEVLPTIVTNGGGFPGGSNAKGGNGTSNGLISCTEDPTTPGGGTGGGGGGGKPKPGFRVRTNDVPSFSKFAVGGIVKPPPVLFIGGGGSHGSPSQFGTSSFAIVSSGEQGFGGILNVNDTTLEKTKIFHVGEKAVLRFDFIEGGGIGNIEHFGFFTNIRDGQKKYVSDASIYYDPLKSPAITINDPKGIFSDANVEILQKDATNFVIQYELTFAKSMPKSDIILESWNLQKWLSTNKLPGSIEVLGSELVQQASEQYSETAFENTQEEIAVPVWIKTNAKLWSEGTIDNDNFISGIEYLVNEGIIQVSRKDVVDNNSVSHLQPWIKNTAGWWADDMISDDEFVTAIEWLISNHIIKIA